MVSVWGIFHRILKWISCVWPEPGQICEENVGEHAGKALGWKLVGGGDAGAELAGHCLHFGSWCTSHMIWYSLLLYCPYWLWNSSYLSSSKQHSKWGTRFQVTYRMRPKLIRSGEAEFFERAQFSEYICLRVFVYKSTSVWFVLPSND